MLKFTKYGKKCASGNAGVNFLSVSKQPVDPPSIVQSTKFSGKGSTKEKIVDPKDDQEGQGVVKNKGVLPVSVKVSTGRQQKPSSEKTQNIPEKSATLPHRGHLSFSKVSKDELLKLDSEINLNLEFIKKPTMKRVRFSSSTVDLGRSNSMKCSRTSMVSLRGMREVTHKVPVYNDGYFPKIQPLNKVFMEMKKKKPG